MNDSILLFSSKWDIIRTIRMIDPSKEKLQNLDLYLDAMRRIEIPLLSSKYISDSKIT